MMKAIYKVCVGRATVESRLKKGVGSEGDRMSMRTHTRGRGSQISVRVPYRAGPQNHASFRVIKNQTRKRLNG